MKPDFDVAFDALWRKHEELVQTMTLPTERQKRKLGSPALAQAYSRQVEMLHTSMTKYRATLLHHLSVMDGIIRSNENECPDCKGTGAVDDAHSACETCHGEGKL